MGFFKKKINLDTYGKESKKEKLKKALKGMATATKKAVDYAIPPKTQDQINFEKELKQKTIKAQREAYLKAAIQESTEKGKKLAKAKYNPQSNKPNQDFMDSMMRL